MRRCVAPFLLTSKNPKYRTEPQRGKLLNYPLPQVPLPRSIKPVTRILFNIVETPFKKLLNLDVCVLYDDVQLDQ